MKCWICTIVEIDEVVIDPRDGKIRHCGTCDNIIQENLAMLSGRKGDDSDFDVPILDEDVLIEDEYDDSDVEDIKKDVDQQGFYPSNDE